MLSKSLQAELNAARHLSKRGQPAFRIDVGGQYHPVLRFWKTGFSVATEDVPPLRGLVDIYKGTQHLFQCLIIAGEADAGEMRYEFKRATPVSDRAALDFVQHADAPVALLVDDRSG
ncbi:MAG: hypothetical protein AAF755_02800 [Pseudomonadota bacterium]